MLQTLLNGVRAARQMLLGPPKSPLESHTRESLALVAFIAWVGLGADGLSSANYGPEAAFLALGRHSSLSIYIAIAIALTVFIIALGYNQVIALFPTGGGGYRVATRLLGPRAGVVSGAALIIDYILTVAISVAAGVDALFSLLPIGFQPYKLPTELTLIVFLLVLNLRGVKESIVILMPVFIGFLVTHLGLILFGVLAHFGRLGDILSETVSQTSSLASSMGWAFVLSVLLRAYSLGGGTYTGIEAVSNNVQRLAEPRVANGRLTMFYMAFSLAIVAGGIVLLYLLWDARPQEGQTLNAVVFRNIMDGWHLGGTALGPIFLAVVLALEAGLLFVAANTGFLGGPPVLANMAIDDWMPHSFRNLSSRLVTQNGLVMMGLAALFILWWTEGEVSLLVVLYSINVFLTFTLTLLGLCVYWVRNRAREPEWIKRLALAGTGFAISGGILMVTGYEKFAEGGWVTVLLTGSLVLICEMIRHHYETTRRELQKADELFMQAAKVPEMQPEALPLDHSRPTAVFMVGGSLGTGVHTLLWVRRLFPGHFANHVFVRVGEIDSHTYDGAEELAELRRDVDRTLNYFVSYSISEGVPAASYSGFGIDVVRELTKMAEQVRADFPNCVFFSSKLIFPHDTWFIRMLHNQTAIAVQRQLHFLGMQMMVLPMRVS